MAPKQSVAGPSRIKGNATQAPPPPVSVAAFNPSRTLFACAQPVLGSADKLTVWDVVADRVIAEWEVEGAAKATTVVWSSIASGAAKKKKRKAGSGTEGEDVVVLTTDKGALIVFTPRRGEVLRRLNVGRVHATASGEHLVLVTAKEILVLNQDFSAVAHTFDLPSGTPASSSAALLPSTPEILHLLIASASVIALRLNIVSSKVSSTSAPLPVSTSQVSSIVTLPTTAQGSSFLVACEDDRTVSQYTLPQATAPAKLSYRYASPTLSPVHSLSMSNDLVSVVHSSGEVSLFPLPKELDFARPKSDSKPSIVKLVEGKEDRQVRLVGAAFSSEDEDSGSLLCGRMTGGGRVKWVKATYELPEGGVKAETIVRTDAQDLVGTAAVQNSIPVQRYSAPATNVEAPATEDEPAAALPADVDQADLSLGERLLALPNGDAPASTKAAAPTLDGPVNAASLTRLLVQALHTSDPALLTLCLSHRDPVLIRNTIRKMPTQLALPLLKACVERLGQGKAAGRRGGGRGVAANEQQGRGTVEWVKGVLVERGSILMTMPSLPLHLATLSSLLQTRMQLYQPLLSLSGRLDLALAQIAMRRLAAEQATQSEGKGEGLKYVEGESDDEDEDDDVHVEVDEDDGEIEDVDMMDRDESSEEDDSESDSDDPLESGSEDGGFLDLEAEESGSGESDDDDEE